MLHKKFKRILAVITSLLITLSVVSTFVATSAEEPNDIQILESENLPDEKIPAQYPTSETAIVSSDSLYVILKRENSDPNADRKIDYFSEIPGIASATSVFKINDWKNRQFFSRDNYREIVKLTFSLETNLNQAVTELEHRNDIKQVVYDYYDPVVESAVQPAATITTNSEEWYTNIYQKDLGLIDNGNAEGTWDITQGSPNVKVGIIDDGIDFAALAQINGYSGTPLGRNFINPNNDFGSSLIYEKRGPKYYTHGTEVASSVLFACPNATIYSLKFRPETTNLSEDVMLQQMIGYAVDNDIAILNRSYYNTLLDPNNSTLDYDLTKVALEAYGGLFISCAGNGIDTNTQPEDIYDDNLDIEARNLDNCNDMPTDWELSNVITVTGTDQTGSKVTNYNDDNDPEYEANFDYSPNLVDVAAPGIGVYVATIEYTNDVKVIKEVSAMGTSFAAPIVAGVAALLWSYYPDATNNLVKHCIMKTVNKYGIDADNVNNTATALPYNTTTPLINYTISGGRVNAYNALLEMKKYLPVQEGVYYIRNRNTAKYLLNSSNTTINQNTYSNVSSKRWEFDYQDNGYYIIKSKANSNYRFYLTNDSQANNTVIGLQTNTVYDTAQQFRILPTTDGNVKISPKKITNNFLPQDTIQSEALKVLQISTSNTATPILYTNGTGLNQEWILEQVSDSQTDLFTNREYYIRNVGTGKYLINVSDNIYPTATFSNADYKIWKLQTPINGTDAQKNGYYNIVSKSNNSYRFDLNNNYEHIGNSIGLQTVTAYPAAQNYKFTVNADGTYRITPLKTIETGTNRCLADTGADLPNLQNQTTADNQKWVLEETSKFATKEVYIVNRAITPDNYLFYNSSVIAHTDRFRVMDNQKVTLVYQGFGLYTMSISGHNFIWPTSYNKFRFEQLADGHFIISGINNGAYILKKEIDSDYLSLASRSEFENEEEANANDPDNNPFPILIDPSDSSTLQAYNPAKYKWQIFVV